MTWKKILALGLACTLFITDQSIAYAAENKSIELQSEEMEFLEESTDMTETDSADTEISEESSILEEEETTEEPGILEEEETTEEPGILEEEETTEESGVLEKEENSEGLIIEEISEPSEILESEGDLEENGIFISEDGELEEETAELRVEELWVPENIKELLSEEEWFSRQGQLFEKMSGKNEDERFRAYFRLLTEDIEIKIYKCMEEYYQAIKSGEGAFSTKFVFSMGDLVTDSNTLEGDAADEFRINYQQAARNALWAFLYDYADVDWLELESCELKITYTGSKQEEQYFWSVQGEWEIVCKYEEEEAESIVSERMSGLEEYDFSEKTPSEIVKSIYEGLTNRMADAEETDSEHLARAFKQICDYAGIECVMVGGKSEELFGVWNYVCPDGENWYTVDLYNDINCEDGQSNRFTEWYLFTLLKDAGFMVEKTDYEDDKAYIGYKAAYISKEEYLSGILSEERETPRYWVHAGSIREILEKVEELSDQIVEADDQEIKVENTGYVYVGTCVSKEFEGELEEEGVMISDGFSGILFTAENDGEDYRSPEFPILHLSAGTNMVLSGESLSSGTTIGFCEDSKATVTVIADGSYVMSDGEGGEDSFVLDSRSEAGEYVLNWNDSDEERTTAIHVSHIQEASVSVTGDAVGSTVASDSWKDNLVVPEELWIPVIDGEEWGVVLNVDSMTSSEAGSGAVTAINSKTGYLTGTAYYKITMSVTSGNLSCNVAGLSDRGAEISLAIPASFATSYGTVKAVRYCDETARILSGKESSGKIIFTADRFSTSENPVVYSLVLVSNLKYSITNSSDLTAAVTGTTASSATKLSVPASVQYGGKTYKVTAINSNAFKNNTKLQTIAIGANVISVGASAFYNCKALTKMTIPNKVTSIGSSAFYGCTKLSALTLGAAVTTIGSKAFYKCTALTKLTIPNKVTSIGTYAFYGNTKLSTVTVGSAVKTIGSYAFYGCTKLSTLTLGAAVTTIGSKAFYKCTALTKLTIPNKVTSIGTYAFYGNTKLTTVKIGTAVKTIGSYAFYGCTKLSTLTLGAAVTTIGSKAFYKCTALTKLTIPNKVTSIGTYAFYGNTKLTTVKIGTAVKTIGSYAFYGCTKLSTLTLGAAVTTIGNYAFYKCTALTKLTIPNKVTSIGTYAFYGNTKLTTVKIGTAVKTIGSYAFYGCTKLSTLTLGAAVTTIGSKAFYKCTALTKLTIPNKVTSIGTYAFYSCTKLSNLTIGTSVKSIGSSAFYGCKNLKTITIKTTKLTSSNVGNNAFKGIYSKVKIKVPIGMLSAYKKLLLAKGVPSTAIIYTISFSNSDKVKVKSCSASSYNSDKGKMTIKVKISLNDKIKELNTMNSSFYILRMDSLGTSVLAKVSATVTSTSDSSMVLSGSISSSDGFASAMMSTYAVAFKDGSKYRQITTNALFIENPEITATMTEAYNGYYESGGKVTSKKGLQGASEDYMEDLGVQHVLLNVDLANMVSTKAKAGYVKYLYKGKTYYFQDMISLVQTMRYLNGWDNDNPYGWHRRNVTLVLLLSWKDDLSYLIHPSARRKGAAPYYTLNMEEKKARETFEALFCYMGEKLGDNKKSRVCNWVLGNEVNCCQAWNYSGSMSLSDCVENYATAFQLLYQGVKRTASTSRVFISLDHSWAASNFGHSGKMFLDAFASYMYKTAPKMQWNVDYHPYSQPLTKVDFWNDGSNTKNSSGTPYISMKNISVLTNYLGTLETKYGKAKGSIRVILGEQGFTAVQGNSGSEKKQAAALGYGYYIAAFNTRVDAYIIRSYLDDRDETRTGLYLGLMSTSHKKKASYDVYKYIDTDKSTTYMKKYLSTVGLSSWKKGISNFSENVLNTGDF